MADPTEKDDDALASEWAAMAEGGEEGDLAGAAGRVLNQDEIDSLLGFDGAGGSGADQSGIRAIINSALVSYGRLPMLEIVFDRLVRMMSTSLRNFTGDNVEVSLDNISSVRFGEYLNSIPLPAILAVFRAEEWDNYGLLTVESNLIYSIVDVLLGGRKGTHAMRIEGRPYATIEPVRELLLQMFMGEKFGRDRIWEGHLATEIYAADIEIDAVMHEVELPLSRVLALEEGDTVMFEMSPTDPVTLRCGDVDLTQGIMGHIGRHISVKVDRPLNPPKVTMAAFEDLDLPQEKK